MLLAVNQLALAFTPWPWWSGPRRWWCASAAPAGWSASNCAGWPGRPRWLCWGRWLPWVAWRVGATALVTWTISACFAVLPVAIGAAILRYRLYDLDRVISRTLAYGLLTLLLGGGYAVVVLVLGQLLGRDSSLVVAAATLAVAAVFQPARRRVQAAVDRRFNRRRHDAAQVIKGFAVRLRDQVDLDALHTELLAVVDQTMQPTQASLWLRQGPSNGLAAAVGPGTHHQEQAT